MVGWADKWQAAACTTLCLAAVSELDVATLESRDIDALLRGPSAAVREGTAYAGAIEAKCRTWLLQRFKDVWLVITDRQRLESFCSLSHAAVGCLCWSGWQYQERTVDVHTVQVGAHCKVNE